MLKKLEIVRGYSSLEDSSDSGAVKRFPQYGQ